MSAPANLGFETAGASLGDAASWVRTAVSTAMEIAGYSGPPEKPSEGFEDWIVGYEAVFGGGDLEAALYDSITIFALSREGFEVLWNGNESYLFALGLTESASYDTAAGPGTANTEHFEESWLGNELFVTSFGMGALSALGAEDFEGWVAGYATSFGLGTLSAASYDTAPQAFEDFENEWTLVMVSM